jgi:hypothetical protein
VDNGFGARRHGEPSSTLPNDGSPGRDAPQSTSTSETGGSLRWYSNLEMEGGPPLARPVFSLTFMGGNVSQKEVSLKTANIVSTINGKTVQLEIIARDDQGKNQVTPIEEINLIPPGVPTCCEIFSFRPGTGLVFPHYVLKGRHRTPAVPVKAMRCNARMALIVCDTTGSFQLQELD